MWGFGKRLEKVEGKEGQEGSSTTTEAIDGVVGRPIAVEGGNAEEGKRRAEYVDFEGRRKPIKKWLGIW